MPDGLEDVKTFAQRIKTAYPDYGSVDDYELVSRIVNKHPDYRSRVKGFDIQGADELKLSPAMTSHYLRLYEQFEQAGIKPFVKKLGGFRTAEDENYLYRTGHPTMGNTGYGDKISPHQEGRAIDFSFSPEQKARGRQILAEYARTNGLHIPGTEPWHIALPKWRDNMFGGPSEAGEAVAGEPPQQPGRVPERPVTLQRPKGLDPARQKLMTLTPEEQARLGAPSQPSIGRRGVPTMADVITEAKTTPYAPSVRQQIAKQVEDEFGSVLGQVKEAIPFVGDPIGIVTKSREKYFNDEVERRYQEYLRSQTPEVIAGRKVLGKVPGLARGAGAPELRAGAGVLKALGGVTSLAGLTPNRLSEYLNKKGELLSDISVQPLNAQGEAIVQGLPEKAVAAVGDLSIGVMELIAIKHVTGWPLGRIMAVETALKNSDKPLAERSKEVAKAYVMGRVLDQHLSKPASAVLFGGPTAVETGISYAQGKMTLEDALLQTGIQAGAGAIMGGKGKVPEKPAEIMPNIAAAMPEIPEVPVGTISQPRVIKKGAQANATQEGIVRQGGVPEYPRVETVGTQAVPSSSNRVEGSAEVAQKEVGVPTPPAGVIAPQSASEVQQPAQPLPEAATTSAKSPEGATTAPATKAVRDYLNERGVSIEEITSDADTRQGRDITLETAEEISQRSGIPENEIETALYELRQQVRPEEVEDLPARVSATRPVEGETVAGKVLAHVAGPSGAGKTEIVNKLSESVKNIDLVDLDIFDEQAVKALGLENKPKNDFTDAELDQVHAKRQELIDAYVEKSDKPIVFFGHHIEGENVTNLPTEDRYLLNVNPTKAALNASRRPGKTAAQVKEDVAIGKRDVKQLKEMDYEPLSSRAIFSKIKAMSEALEPSTAPTVAAPKPKGAPTEVAPKTVPQIGEPVAHPNPKIVGKEIVATTQDGRVIVANEETKSGVSMVTPKAAPSIEGLRDHPDPLVDAASKSIIRSVEAGDLGGLAKAVESLDPEARMQVQGLVAQIAKEKASAEASTRISSEAVIPSAAEPSRQAGTGVPEPNQGVAGRGATEASEGIVPEPQNLGPGARSIHEPAPEVKERKFGIRLMADERLADEIKDSLGTSRYYEPIPNTVTAENAAEFVNSRGIPEAMKAIRDEQNNTPFHVRSAAGQIVILRLNEAIRNLKDVNPEKARFLLDQATEMAEWAMDYGTRLGQGVQSFAMWKRLLPEGKLLSYKRVVEKIQKEFEGKRNNGEDVQEIVRELNQPTITITNAETAEAAQVIKEAIEKQLTGKGKVPTPESVEREATIWEQYKDSIAKQLASAAIPGKAKESPPLQEFTNRLLSNVEGLIRKPETAKVQRDVYGEMREVIQNFDKYQEAWNEAISFIRSKYDGKSLTELNELERRITDLNSAFQTRAFDKVYNDAVKQAELNFRDIAKSHYLDKQATRDDLIQRIQDGLGIKLTPEEAERMVSRVEQKLEAQILRGREQILKQLEQSGNKIAKKVLPITDKLIEAARVGILTEKKFYELAAEKLGLPKYDTATAEKIYDLAGKVEDAAEGIPKDKATFELNKFILSQKGFSPWDLPTGIYYGNILSGYNTNLVNTIDTAINVMHETTGLAINDPRAAAHIYAGLLRGLNEGKFDALNVLTSGRMITDGKWLEVPQLMEIAKFGKKGGVPIRTDTRFARITKAVGESKVALPLNSYKYATRLLAASDAVFFRGAKEARASLLAYRMAEAEGLKGDALINRMHEILATDRIADFQAQAKREGFTGAEAHTRAIELQEFARSKDLNADAAEFAGEATYNHDPHGLLGMFSNGLSKWSQQFPPLKLFVPFTRIVANVTNRGLNYTPWGFKRALPGIFMDFDPNMTPEARRLLITRATVGTAGLVTLGAMQYSGLLQIHGNGPSDSEKRRQMVNAGWKPYSIQLGDNYISYIYSPLGLGLSVVGNMTDSQRYHEMEQKDAGTRGAYALMRVGSTVFSQSFLAGLSRLFSALSDDPRESVGAVKQTLSGTTAALTTPNIVRDIARLFDNTQYQSSTLMEDLVRNTPFAALALRPQLNAFGETVELPRQRFVSRLDSDPAWRFVMARGLRVPVPSRTAELKPGVRMTPEQYYNYLQTTGPQIKKWIADNQLRLSGMSEDKAQDELSEAAKKIHQTWLNQMAPLERVILPSLFRGIPGGVPEMPSPTPPQ